MNGPGHKLLAGAGLADDQNRGLGGRDHGRHVQQFAYGRTLADDLGALEFPPQALLKGPVLRLQPHMVQGPVHGQPQHVQVQGLDQVVVGPGLERLHGGFHRGIGGHDQDRHGRIVVLDRAQDLDPVHSGHAHVGDHQIAGPFAQGLQGRRAAGRPLDPVSPSRKHRGQHGQVPRVVVHNQDARLHAFSFASMTRPAGR
jgi:hypothetical protein